jgi:hypothetical protein
MERRPADVSVMAGNQGKLNLSHSRSPLVSLGTFIFFKIPVTEMIMLSSLGLEYSLPFFVGLLGWVRGLFQDSHSANLVGSRYFLSAAPTFAKKIFNSVCEQVYVRLGRRAHMS